jgi:hypothetical protein
LAPPRRGRRLNLIDDLWRSLNGRSHLNGLSALFHARISLAYPDEKNCSATQEKDEARTEESSNNAKSTVAGSVYMSLRE